MFESRLGTNTPSRRLFCETLLGRGAVGAFFGAYFKIHGRKDNFLGIKSPCCVRRILKISRKRESGKEILLFLRMINFSNSRVIIF